MSLRNTPQLLYPKLVYNANKHKKNKQTNEKKKKKNQQHAQSIVNIHIKTNIKTAQAITIYLSSRLHHNKIP